MGKITDVTIYRCDGCGREIRKDDYLNNDMPSSWIEPAYGSRSICLSIDGHYFEISMRDRIFCQAECFALFVQEEIIAEMKRREEAKAAEQTDEAAV